MCMVSAEKEEEEEKEECFAKQDGGMREAPDEGKMASISLDRWRFFNTQRELSPHFSDLVLLMDCNSAFLRNVYSRLILDIPNRIVCFKYKKTACNFLIH